MKVKDMVLNQLKKGSKYRITHYDKDNGFTVWRTANILTKIYAKQNST